MSENERIFWGIHVTGSAGDALYLKQKHVAIGWPEAGDLKKLRPDRESFKETVGQVYSGQKRGWTINSASQLYRFVHEMQSGDYVIYRSKHDHMIHIGEVSGDYRFDSKLSAEYPAKGIDEGIDIVAHKDELKLEPPIVKVQVKSTEGSVGGPDVRALYGNVGHGEVGLLVTLGTFSRQAEDFAKGKSNLRLIDGTELVQFVLNHYEDFDPRFKAILPLKRVYIPAPMQDAKQ